MANEHNPPVTIQVYLGSGKAGAKLLENIDKRVDEKGPFGRSRSEVIVSMMKKADPGIFKGVESGKRA